MFLTIVTILIIEHLALFFVRFWFICTFAPDPVMLKVHSWYCLWIVGWPLCSRQTLYCLLVHEPHMYSYSVMEGETELIGLPKQCFLDLEALPLFSTQSCLGTYSGILQLLGSSGGLEGSWGGTWFWEMSPGKIDEHIF